MDKEGQWVEGSISNAGRVVWAESDIIWADWLFCHIIVGTKEKEGHNKIEEEEILK